MYVCIYNIIYLMYVYIYKQNVKFPLNPTNGFETLRKKLQRKYEAPTPWNLAPDVQKKQQGNVSQNARTFQVNDD